MTKIPASPSSSAGRLGPILRLRGGGGDGGVYPLTHTEMQWMQSANMGVGTGIGAVARDHRHWADRASEDALRLDRATLCAASSKPLAPPVVVTELGLLCNKEELLERLLSKSMPQHLAHVQSLRDFAEAQPPPQLPSRTPYRLPSSPPLSPPSRDCARALAPPALWPLRCPRPPTPRPPQATLHPNPHYAADKAAKGGEAAEDRLGAAPMVSERDSTLVMS